MLDYATLKIVWWALIFFLFAGFFVLGGRDFGVCLLLPFVSRHDADRRLVLNAIGSTWEGNQVWFITAAAALFAAWPIVYATAFSALYHALFLVLLTLILRPPGIDYRSKMPSPLWRRFWDWTIFSSGLVPTFVFGLALGNIFEGVPFHFDSVLRSYYEGSFIQLFRPFGIVLGLSALCLLGLHAAIFLQYKLPETVEERLRKMTLLLSLLFIGLFLVLGRWVRSIEGYHVTAIGNVQTVLTPLMKEVEVGRGLWLWNYARWPFLWGLPIATVSAVVLGMICSWARSAKSGFFLSSVAIVSALLTAAAALYPFILPSSSHPHQSLTLWDVASSHRTLLYMLWIILLFLPIVLAYTAWAFRVLRGKVTHSDTLKQPESY